jgi:hypothetical protein
MECSHFGSVIRDPNSVHVWSEAVANRGRSPAGSAFVDFRFTPTVHADQKSKYTQLERKDSAGADSELIFCNLLGSCTRVDDVKRIEAKQKIPDHDSL